MVDSLADADQDVRKAETHDDRKEHTEILEDAHVPWSLEKALLENAVRLQQQLDRLRPGSLDDAA